MEKDFQILSIATINSVKSDDGLTQKILFQLNDGNLIESVLIRSDRRLTLCISTQSGCPVKCVFCATGNIGFIRNLSSGEIVEQVVSTMHILKPGNESLTNIVLMGMGEPFLNFENSLTAVDRLNDASGFNFGARRITISTIGIIEGIEKLADAQKQYNLSVSLHAPNDTLRKQLIPLAKHNPIEKLIQAIQLYFSKTGRRVTFEYVMIDGVNDTPDLAAELVVLLKGMNCHVNLIPLNPNPHYKGQSSKPAVIKEFGRILIEHHIPTSIRDSQGSDIQAGCGQLAGRIENKK